MSKSTYDRSDCGCLPGGSCSICDGRDPPIHTLFDIVMEPHLKQQHKHDLGDGYADRMINELSNVELLQAMSDALEELLEERKL